MKIEIWSDYACPFCYLGDRKLALALNDFEHKSEVEISYKSFQLDVNATSHPGVDVSTLISQKYGIGYEQARASNDKIVKAAYAIGLEYDFDNLKPNNTALAHQVAKYAASLGKEAPLVQRLFKAYFEQGYDLGIKENLLKLAGEVDLDAMELSGVLDAGTFAKEVHNDQEAAAKLGIRGVPYFVFDGKYAVSGAQDVDYFKKVLEEVHLDKA
ncbi:MULTISPECIES: DsbA family oxidoreductase [unclassified Fusibacter]|uniref:DsbA family oxidoreductase n=1 Tax=unclassified Fusibacter TaxID=2624464 RepID=UPI001012EC35|nr:MULTISPECIES: DsbA family oxidoreductase [unclassified Fusibacter]MCK8060916.1 DsbA family oxidoreductase [Fusibacter sp. A2]NPE23212.1 DsbA family oxidoreductase [Fusibacter sp. A1]RXV59568.1 DsbA family oxidoreductase [Fusibacter sp. A1]